MEIRTGRQKATGTFPTPTGLRLSRSGVVGSFVCPPLIASTLLCPCCAYITIGSFNFAEISRYGVEPPSRARKCFSTVVYGLTWKNYCFCWAQGNRRKTLEVKLLTATNDHRGLNSACVQECPAKVACLHMFCHPCALQEVLAVNN